MGPYPCIEIQDGAKKTELFLSHWYPGKGRRLWAQIETKRIPLNRRRKFCPVRVIKH